MDSGWGGYPRPVPDVRVYRAAFAPAVVALFVAAFSLADRPAAVTTPFAPGFDGSRAFDSMQQLGEAFPDRPAGSDADRALAARVAESFRANGFRVSRSTDSARTVGGSAGARDGGRRAAGPVEPADRRDGPSRRARLARARRAVGHGGAARVRARVQGARPLLHAGPRLDLGRQRRRRRGATRSPSRPTARSTPRSCSATSRARRSTSPGSSPGPTTATPPRWGSAARSSAPCARRRACRRAARARSASGRGGRCR